MQNTKRISSDLIYVGASDRRLHLFENVYPIPFGVSYNAYVLLDEKAVLLDTCDKEVTGAFLENLRYALNGRPLDALIVNHMEPDHAANIARVLDLYPDAEVYLTLAASKMLQQFFGAAYAPRLHTVKEGDSLNTGRHTLKFIAAPMVHWPEVMVTFDETDGVLFSADAFGTFGALNGSLFADEEEISRFEWDEMRRYYANIVGKYGVQVQNLLKKASALPIRMICPLHGPIWRENLSALLEKYDLWSRWQGEEGVVIFCASIYGNTLSAMERLAALLNEKGVKHVRLYDLSAQDPSFMLAEAFRAKAAVFASASYNAGVFIKMEELLHDLKAHDYKNHVVAYVENGTWAPSAAKTMKGILEGQALTVAGETLTIRSVLSDEAPLCALADVLKEAIL